MFGKVRGANRRRGSYVPLPETSTRMKAVRQEGTAAELAVRQALSALGLRYRLNVRTLPGSPDVANASRGFAVFVHGCFWHRHPRCPSATMPKTNKSFWKRKFADNVARDRKKIRALEECGVHVVVVWECETKRPGLAARLSAAIAPRK